MTKRYTIKFRESYNSEDPDLIQIYDNEDMTYTGFFDVEDKGLAEEICKLCNSLDYELKQANKEIVTLNRYLPVDKGALDCTVAARTSAAAYRAAESSDYVWKEVRI